MVLPMAKAEEHGASANPPGRMSWRTLSLPPGRIALFKAVIESYDNLATLRTEVPSRHHLKLFFAPESAPDIDALLAAISAEFEIQILARG
jgi:hypothetical protein